MRFISKVLMCFPLIAYGLPELKTKQAIQNIRYISQDGLVTYYQKSSGHLQFATNYNFQTVMKSEKNTEYKLVVSEAVGKVAIEVDKTFFQTNNLKKDNDIFLAVYKSSEKPKKVGAGTAPRFHLSTGWLSYFKSTEKSSRYSRISTTITLNNMDLTVILVMIADIVLFYMTPCFKQTHSGDTHG